ncbi:hypothetical protein DPMN_175372 [Dreissena polymorpha]|uniref:Uncharacterized protein n=1 Tax=Dreissena polymorpha TaxID=45954 RepID=A0A9D4E6C9_DREPO|nr:hypothetical protein DPMN_175372 [Dreissena polymorpha]
MFSSTLKKFALHREVFTTSFLTKFHKDWAIHVNSRVLTRFYYIIRTKVLTKFHEDWNLNKTATNPGGHVFQLSRFIVEVVQDIIFYEALTKHVTSIVKFLASGGHVFKCTGNMFELFDKYWTIHMTSRVLTRENCPFPCDYVFQPTRTISELVQRIIGTPVRTKNFEDWTIHNLKEVNVDDGRRTTEKRRSQKLTMSMLC